MLGRGKRTRRAVLAAGVGIAVAVAVGVAAVAISAAGGRRSASGQGQPLGNHTAAAITTGAGASRASSRQEHLASGSGAESDRGRPGTGRSHLVSSGSDASRAAKVSALVRAVGKNPKNMKVVPLVPTSVRVRRGEALPCTGEEEPINFEIFSAGPSVAGKPLHGFTRRCEETVPAYQDPANYTNYLYGECEITAGATGCQAPLEIQSFPACQRALADYTLEGQPLPYKELGTIGEAVVVEIDLMGEPRIEVYTGSTTIVIFATEWALAEQALAQLTPQQAGDTPATTAAELGTSPDPSLAAPSAGAIQGELPCR